MRLLTTQKFSHLLCIAYGIRGYNETLGNVLYTGIIDDTLQQLIKHAIDSGDHIPTWQNDLAVIKYFIDNFVEEF